MKKANRTPLSVYGVPLVGLAGLVVCLWHPQVNLQSAASGPDATYMVTPSPKMDKSMTVFLVQEAKNVAASRQHSSERNQAQAIASYNLIAEECTPAVFKATHLPPAMML